MADSPTLSPNPRPTTTRNALPLADPHCLTARAEGHGYRRSHRRCSSTTGRVASAHMESMTAPEDHPSPAAETDAGRPGAPRSVVVEVDELPDAFGSPVRLGDTVTSAELDPSMSLLLVAATVVGLRRIEGRPYLVLDPAAVTAPLHGGVVARPGKVLQRRPDFVVRHAPGPAPEPDATGASVVDAHGRELVT